MERAGHPTPGSGALGLLHGARTVGFTSLVERRLYHLIVACISVVALPSNFLYYGAPPLFLAGALLLETAVSARRLLLLLTAIPTLTFAALAVDLWQGHRVNPAGMLFSLIMYLPLITLLAQHPSFVASEAFVIRLVRVLCVFIYVQAFASFMQSIYMLVNGDFNPDLVGGTFGLLDVFAGVTISQVLFTFSNFGICVFLATYYRQPRVRLAIGLGLLCCIVAQSGHQTIFFIATVVVLVSLQYGRSVRLVQTSILAVSVIVAVSLVYPETLRLALDWGEKVLVDERSPKRNIVAHAINHVFTAEHVVLGTGLGQFTSRGALFSSGQYLSVPLPEPLTGRSHLFDAYVVPQLELYAIVGESSAIAKPYFSLLSVLSEFGFLVSAALLVVAVSAVTRNLWAYRLGNEEVKGLANYCNFLIIFMFLNSLIENYVEFVQGNFIPIILYVLAQARIRAILPAVCTRRS